MQPREPESRIDRYESEGKITPECAAAWRAAYKAYELALATGHYEQWFQARHEALRHHDPTGDAYSDRIEWQFNLAATMGNEQLTAPCNGGRWCDIKEMELARRQWRPKQ
jgi:hypothetical protein